MINGLSDIVKGFSSFFDTCSGISGMPIDTRVEGILLINEIEKMKSSISNFLSKNKTQIMQVEQIKEYIETIEQLEKDQHIINFDLNLSFNSYGGFTYEDEFPTQFKTSLILELNEDSITNKDVVQLLKKIKDDKSIEYRVFFESPHYKATEINIM